MKLFSTALFGLTLSFAATAQNIPQRHPMEHSGSGNGSLNRSVLEYSQEVEGTKLDFQSLEESLQQLLKETVAISTGERPVLQNPDDTFWSQITDSDLETIRNQDAALIAAVKDTLKEISIIKETVIREEAHIATILRDSAHYERRGMKNDLNKLIKEKKSKLQEKLRKDLAESIRKLFSVISNQVGNGKGGLLKNCQSATCVDVMSKKVTFLFDAAVELTEIEVSLVGSTKTIGRFYSFSEKHDQGNCTFRLFWENIGKTTICTQSSDPTLNMPRLKRLVSKQIEKGTFTALATIHEGQINELNQ